MGAGKKVGRRYVHVSQLPHLPKLVGHPPLQPVRAQIDRRHPPAGIAPDAVPRAASMGRFRFWSRSRERRARLLHGGLVASATSTAPTSTPTPAASTLPDPAATSPAPASVAVTPSAASSAIVIIAFAVVLVVLILAPPLRCLSPSGRRRQPARACHPARSTC